MNKKSASFGPSRVWLGRPPPTDPITIVQNYYNVINAKQLAATTSCFTDNTLLTSSEGKFQSEDAIRQDMKSLIDNKVGTVQKLVNLV
jgi:hypothetical protein